MILPNRPRKRELYSKQSVSKNARSVPLFDLASLLEELPPNTGPQDTTAPNGGSQTGSGKSLSHVPCKFFRQGICQAGKSCPFSHDLDGNALEKLPCKYFQKGNCKFGLKCALAHILPDGTHVNAKPQHPRRHRYDRNHAQMQYHESSNSPFEKKHADNDYTADTGRKESNSYERAKFLDGFKREETQQLFPELSAWLTNYSSNILSPPRDRRSTFSSTNSLWLEDSPFFSDISTNLQSTSLSLRLKHFGLGSSPLYNYTRHSAEELTLFDEDSDAVFGDEDANFEDFVPASIGNLILTPQEQQRRETRSQSGTLLVRPNLSDKQGPIELTRCDDVFLMD